MAFVIYTLDQHKAPRDNRFDEATLYSVTGQHQDGISYVTNFLFIAALGTPRWWELCSQFPHMWSSWVVLYGTSKWRGLWDIFAHRWAPKMVGVLWGMWLWLDEPCWMGRTRLTFLRHMGFTKVGTEPKLAS